MRNPRREPHTTPTRVDDGINFCPYCGKRLERVSLRSFTTCERCGNAFLVLVKDEDNLSEVMWQV